MKAIRSRRRVPRDGVRGPDRPQSATASYPSEAAHFGYLRRQRGGDLAVDLVGFGQGGVRGEETFDLDAQRASGPTGPSVGVINAWDGDCGGFGGRDDVGVDSIERVVSDVRVTSQPTWQMNPVTMMPATASAQAQPNATAISPDIAPAADRASSHECFASAIMVADWIRWPTASL